MNAASNPVFGAGGRQLGLFDVFAATQSGESLELSRLQPHQRGPAAMVLAIMMVALRRYAVAPPQSAADWEGEWLRQVGADALRLIAPEDEVGFFQPPLDPGKNRSAMTLSDMDYTFTKLAHAAKPIANGTAEEAVFALWGGLWGLSVANWRPGPATWCPPVPAASPGSASTRCRPAWPARGTRTTHGSPSSTAKRSASGAGGSGRCARATPCCSVPQTSPGRRAWGCRAIGSCGSAGSASTRARPAATGRRSIRWSGRQSSH